MDIPHKKEQLKIFLNIRVARFCKLKTERNQQNKLLLATILFSSMKREIRMPCIRNPYAKVRTPHHAKNSSADTNEYWRSLSVLFAWQKIKGASGWGYLSWSRSEATSPVSSDGGSARWSNLSHRQIWVKQVKFPQHWVKKIAAPLHLEHMVKGSCLA